MIARRGTLAAVCNEASPSSGWQTALAQAVRDPATLLAALELPAGLLPAAGRAAADFPLLVPRSYLSRIRVGDPVDPLLRQILPVAAENAPQPVGFGCDPLDEAHYQVLPGLLHKYQDRVLLMCTGGCAVHCRYCFRRHFPYQATRRPTGWWQAAVDYVADRPAIHEVVFSGGDPWLLPDAQLAQLAVNFQAVSTIRRLRWHTRLPIVLPERVDAGLCRMLRTLSATKAVVLHANHAQELNEAVAEACARLRGCGVHLLNQTVLLRGVNDSVEALAALSERLAAIGVQPYYLHLLDPVAGAAHFHLPDADAMQLWQQLHARLPGWLLPRLVREQAGAPGKTPLV